MIPTISMHVTDLQTKLAAAAQELAVKSKILTKLRTTLQQAEKELVAGRRPLPALKRVATELKGTSEVDLKFSVSEILALIDHQVDLLTNTEERSLISNIRSAAESAGLAFGKSGDDLTLGPFVLKILPKQDSAKLVYSKIEVASNLPLDSGAIVTQARTLIGETLMTPNEADLAGIAEELEEAIRVTIARKKSPLFIGDFRADLPAVYREMCWIRSRARGSREKGDVYPLSQFVVEVKSLISSTFNLERTRRFKLETAVIENAGNTRKSIFFPTNLQQGWGEGTFFQAIVLLAST